jgi:hypothetical protein
MISFGVANIGHDGGNLIPLIIPWLAEFHPFSWNLA